MDAEGHRALWERRQAELWERIFQLAQDVASLADRFQESAGGAVMKEELLKSAMNIGKYLVRATAADSERHFIKHIGEAKMQAIEADYWLRIMYVVQPHEEVQRDISNVITQIASIVELLAKLVGHLETQHDASEHMAGPKITL